MFNCGVGYVKCQQINKGILLSHLLECKIKPKFLPILAEQILLLVKNMHELGLFNVDLRSDNILVDKDLRIRLLDYKSLINRTGVKEVKPITHLGYTAPEAYYGIIDRRSDIYSAGILIWELINQKRLSGLCADRHIDITVLPKPELLDNDFWDIIKKAASYNPDNRYNTADDMINDIKKCRCYHKNQVEDYIKYKEESVTVSIIGLSNSDDLPLEGSNPITKELPNGNGDGSYGQPDNNTGGSTSGNVEETQFDLSDEKPASKVEETVDDNADEKTAYSMKDPLVGNIGHTPISKPGSSLQRNDKEKLVSYARGSSTNPTYVTEAIDSINKKPQKEVLYSQVYFDGRSIKPGYYLLRPKTEELISIDTDSFTVGRSKDANWQIDDQRVSSVHATLLKRNNYIYIEDNNSTNGTYINNQLLKPHISKRLKDKDTVRFGIAEVVFINNGDNKDTLLFKEYLQLRNGILFELQSNDDSIRNEKDAYRYVQRLSNLFKALPLEEKKESIDFLKQFHARYPMNEEIALAYAETLGNLVAEHPDSTDDCISRISEIYNQHNGNENIALVYAEALNKLIFEQPDKADDRISRVSEIYNQHKRNERIALVYAEALNKLIFEQPDKADDYISQLSEIHNQHKGNEHIALEYVEVLDKLIFEQPNRGDKYISQLRQIYHRYIGSEKIALTYAKVLRKLIARYPFVADEYINQLRDIYYLLQRSDEIALVYVDVLESLIARYPDRADECIRQLREIYSKHKDNEKIAQVYAEALSGLIAIKPYMADEYVDSLVYLCNKYVDNEEIAHVFAEVLCKLITEQPNKAEKYINLLDNLCRKYPWNEEIAQEYAHGLLKFNAFGSQNNNGSHISFQKE